MLYLNLPNTCYRCQSAEHKIKDYPLATPRVKSPPKVAPAKQAEGKKEEWVTVGGKGKPVGANPLAPKPSYAAVTVIPPISTDVSTPASVEKPVASVVPIPGVLQVSNPASS